MEFDHKQDCTGVDWKVVSDTLKRVGMGGGDSHLSVYNSKRRLKNQPPFKREGQKIEIIASRLSIFIL